MSRPWMPLYVRDYIADTVHLSTIEHGAYLMLIMHYWLHGALPADEKKLARIARLDVEQWTEIRTTLAELFEPDWRHKRVEAELATTDAKYQRRAEAGRQGGIASGLTRQKRTNAEAMLFTEQSNAEAKTNQPQPQPQPHKEEGQSGAPSPADLSDEERLWYRLDGLEAKGISRSRSTQLLKLNGGDFIEANRALDTAEQAKKPGQYLGAVIRNLQVSGTATSPGANPHVPAWVNERRAAGILVERDGNKSWRSQGEILNEAGEVVGF